MRGVKRLVFVFCVLSTLIACRIYQNVNVILHANMDGSCLYSTEGNVTQQLFCVALPDMINGIGYAQNSVYLAIGRGENVEVQKRTMSGEIEQTFSLQTEAGQFGTLYDLAVDENGLWAANGNKLIHYSLNTALKDKEISLPEGYYSTYGVAYDEETGNIFALLSDETGLDRNCPAIATYNSSLEMINFFLVPGIDCLDVAFGLGYDELNQSFWTSTSWQTPDPNLLLNFSATGELIQSIPINHIYGSVENYQTQREIPTTGQVQITILADISQGREGRLQIVQDNPDGTNSLVQELPIVIQNNQQFGFDLAVGNYWATVNGLGFTSYAEFTVLPGKTSEVVMEMVESPVYTWYPNLAASSPFGEKTPGYGIPIMEFWLAHNQEEPIKPDHLTFTLTYTDGVSFNACYLTYLDEQSGFFVNLGATPVLNNQVYFGVNNGPLNLADISVVPAHDMTTYRLACDVFAAPNDALRASLTDFLGQPKETLRKVWNLPLYGYVLTF